MRFLPALVAAMLVASPATSQDMLQPLGTSHEQPVRPPAPPKAAITPATTHREPSRLNVSREQQSTFVYSKTTIKINPKNPEMSPEPQGTEKSVNPENVGGVLDPAVMMPALQRTPKEFVVDLRTQDFLQQKDFIVMQPFADREGMMILIEPAARFQLKATRMISSADVLFADSDGYITKMAPDLKFPTLTETIDSDKPIHAVIYLKSGTIASSDIQIGDRVENMNFQTHPVVIQ